MRFIIEYSRSYFCCSTLPLLNGGIEHVMNDKRYIYRGARIIEKTTDLADMFNYILEYLTNEIKLYPKMPYKLKKEHKRMINLYHYRIEHLKKGGFNG